MNNNRNRRIDLPLMNRNVQGNERFEWTDDLRDDLMRCFELSSPNRRGYMQRLHRRWCTVRPEHSTKTQQQLRDYVSYLRRIGYVAVRPVPEPVEQVTPPPAPRIVRYDENLDLRTRRIKISMKIRPKPEHLETLNDELEALPEDVDLLTLNTAVYNAAVTLVPRRRHEHQDAERKLQLQLNRLEAKIRKARKRASRIQCVMDYMSSGRQYTAKVKRIVAGLRRQHHILNIAVLMVEKQHCLERLRVFMAAKKTTRKREKGRTENALFLSNPSRLFEEPAAVVENPPTEQQVHEFWRNLYERPSNFNADTPALKRFADFCTEVLPPEGEACNPITEEEVSRALAKVKNFSAPGPDGINSFWWKKFTSVHKHLARIFSNWLEDGELIPSWVVEGRTVLLPKKGDLSDPKNYRPITCLNTCYKTFTAILNTRILKAVNPVWRQIYEQRGSKNGVAGCKEDLLIDRCVTQDSVQYKRDLSMAWIDYQKAFDKTSHELLLYLLQCLKVHPEIVRCIEHLFTLWQTRFTIRSGNRVVMTELVRYMRGVFQGDALSPLLFCISLLPLSVALRDCRGYSCGAPGNRTHRITHLFYVDDLKLYASSKRDLQQSLKVVQEYTRDIGMRLGLEKCAAIHLRRGRSTEVEENVQLIDGNIIRHLGVGETYQYLGLPQRQIQATAEVKESLRSRYKQMLRKIWSSELSGVNKVSATNMLAVPIVSYSFGVVKWTLEELHRLDIDTRKVMNMCRSLHPKSSVPRLYLPREQGGRGLLSLECLHDRIVLDIASAVLHSDDPLLRLVHTHEMNNVGAFLYRAARRAADNLDLDFSADPQRDPQADDVEEYVNDLLPTRLRRKVKCAEQMGLLSHHVEKALHGVFYRHMGELGLSKELTFSFLRSAGLKSETEGFIMACQDGVINTLAYRRNVLKMNVPSINCRVCHGHPETLMHLLSACPVLAPTAYVHRHNAALRVLYYHLRHSYGIDEAPVLPYAPGDIESVVENDKCRIYWNFSFHTTRQLTATKPDIVLLDKTARVIYVIEFSAPAEKNIIVKEEDKRTKYQELCVELRHIYPGFSVKTVVLIIGVLGGMRDTYLRDLKIIPACRQSAVSLACRMQKAVILGSLRLLRAQDLTGA